MKSIIKKLSISAVALALSGASMAANLSVSAPVEYAANITLAKIQDMSFGVLDKSQVSNNRYVIIKPDGTVLDSGSGILISNDQQPAIVQFSGHHGLNADMTIATTTQPEAGTIDFYKCIIDSGSEFNCATTSTVAISNVAKTLKIGATINYTGTPTSTTDTPRFLLTMTYQ